MDGLAVPAEDLALRGSVTCLIRNASGRILRRLFIPNKTNNNARAAVAKWMTGVGNVGIGATPYPTQMQLGTGTGTPAATDTGLFTAAAGTLVAITNASTYQTFYAQFVAYWGSTTPAGNYTEAVLLDSAGVCWAHVLLQTSASQPYIPISAGQTLTVLWKINVLGN